MKTAGAAPSRQNYSLVGWRPEPSDLKFYPHFDAPLKLAEVKALVEDRARVARNAFFPLIQYEKRWQPFRKPKGKTKPNPKIRKIRYASRRDAYIYAKYRRELSPLYEAELTKRGLSEIPIAYRKIKGTTGKGKCNIDFAKDAFDCILSMKNSFVITLDISQFFESLDHANIRSIWCKLLEVQTLPSDHEAVCKSLTQYRWIEREKAYERLGYFGSKVAKNGTQTKGFLKSYKDIPIQLCKPSVFREKIAGGGKLPSIIQDNKNPYGIPQGTPISDLIANMYMIEFDEFLKTLALAYNGKAFRYSDDIAVILETDSLADAKATEKAIRNGIAAFGAKLVIKPSKSSIHRFFQKPDGAHGFEHISGIGKNGFEYLGFRFDGERVFLRDSTVSNLKRKMTFSGRLKSSEHKKRYSNRTPAELINTFNFEHFFQTFMRVEEFDTSLSVKNWTFWTYARRASETFGKMGRPILKQLRHLRPDGTRLIRDELSK